MPKRQRIDLSVREVQELARKAIHDKRCAALHDIKKCIVSKQAKFDGGDHGLQARRAQAIESCLHLVVARKETLTVASVTAAEAHGFSPAWGAHLVRQWTAHWVNTRALPQSLRGHHPKVASILSDPTARCAIRTYMCSNKWSLNPPRLQKLLQNELTPDEARAYTQQITSHELPHGLKAYAESTLLPSMQLKLGREGFSLSSARRLMLRKGWLFGGEQPLRKKGAGRGLHQSDFICSTVGWLDAASATLEYGKNHDGFWNGELFIKQLTEKFFPAFKATHGDGQIAVVLVDNSQGHASYATDALGVSEINMRPGGKQPRMQDRWYMRNGVKITQSMVFPSNHATFPNQPKGIRACSRSVLRTQAPGLLFFLS
ncbi:hypothetical protein C8Q80DRAFT_1298111 [Daedaleopsis nitida]|nr:hypothetical protein C8Q80DRAFT_1298111 [Daedaleopsis nitida]